MSFAANQLTQALRVSTLAQMRRIVLLCLVPLALGAADGARGEIPRLVATVGPGFTIELADANGRRVSQLVPGRYELLVHDLADSHNFALGSKTTQQRIVETTVESSATRRSRSTCRRARTALRAPRIGRR